MELKTRFHNAVRKAFRKALMAYKSDGLPMKELQNDFYDEVFTDLFADPKKGWTDPKAEETAAEMIRAGVPKDCVRATFLYIEVRLRNGTVFLHRPSSLRGTVQVDWNGNDGAAQATLSPKDLADTLLFLDEQLPGLAAKGEELLRRISAEIKAEEIQRTAVKNQLEAVLPPMGIACSFDVKDDKVHLCLNRAFRGDVDLPLTELAAFLSDPERILATLQLAEPGFVQDSKRHYTFPGPHFKFPGI